MEKFTLEVTQGEFATAKEARNAKRVPMVYYGKGVENANFSADYQDFRRIYSKAGRSSIINFIDENKKEFPVLVHQIQYHPVTDDVIHVDVMAVDLLKPITTDVPLVFVGQSLAMKELAGVFTTNRDRVGVECLPKDLPHEIEVSIESLVDFNASIKVADIVVPNGVTITTAPELNVASVSAPRVAEEEVAVAETETVEEEASTEEATKEGGEKKED